MPVTLITGTSTGIGLATAIHLAREGHEVYATMRNPDGGAAELNKVVTAEDLPVTVLQLDVDDDASVRNAIDEVLDRAGHIDALVNNAGFGVGGTIEDTEVNDFRRGMETNFFGALRCIKAVLPQMRERRSGCIVNVTSIAGRITSMVADPYTASKFALEAASEDLALEMRPFDVRVAIIEPGVILTPIYTKVVPRPEGSPYAKRYARITQFFAKRLQDPGPAELVAEAISHAISTDKPKLRYLVGADAEAMVPARARMTDEEWVEFGAEQSDEQWYARFEQALGIDLRPTD